MAVLNLVKENCYGRNVEVEMDDRIRRREIWGGGRGGRRKTGEDYARVVPDSSNPP